MYENYAKIRDSKGLSDYQVAQMAGVSRSVFSDWKTGRHTPSKTTRYKISKVLGLPPIDKFVGEQEDAFVLESKSFLDAKPKIAEYEINLDGQTIFLEADKYRELKKAVDAFTETWIRLHTDY